MRSSNDWSIRIALTFALVSVCCFGCKPADQSTADTPSDLELAVTVPDGGADPGTVPDDQTMNPPDIFVDAETEMNLTLGAEGPVPDPVPDTGLGLNSEDGTPESLGNGVGENDIFVGPKDWRTWAKPEVVLMISGHQHGYIEPCGCTGLENQKGGLMRRYSLLSEIRDKGWDVLPVDAGNQIRRTGRQAAIKFQTSVKGLQEMGYKAIGFGPEDLMLGASELLSIAADDGSDSNPFVTCNVEIIAPDLVASFRKVEVGGRVIGITTALDPKTVETSIDDAIQVVAPEERIATTLTRMKEAGCDFTVLLFYGSNDSARKVALDVPGFDLVVAGATYGEPKYQAELIEGSATRLVMTGDKGMFVGLIGLFADGPFEYARVALNSDFEDARPMLDLMADYQSQLKQLGLDGLEVQPVSHVTGRQYVGTQKCGECHTTAHAIWEGTPHAEATEDIVHPGERSEIQRHFDPECLSCHVTGWNPQEYYPYIGGYKSLEESPLMVANGCENCHGPGKEHADAEVSGSGVSAEEIKALREGVRLSLDRARDKCLECHDLDNSPDFHLEGAFEEYWSQVEHYGVD